MHPRCVTGTKCCIVYKDRPCRHPHAAAQAKGQLSAVWDGSSLQRCSSEILHAGELLPPVGEVAEGVGAGEVGGGGSQL